MSIRSGVGVPPYCHVERSRNISRKGNDVNYRKYSVQNFQVSACVQSTLNAKQALARSCGLSFCLSHFESEEWLRGRNCENKCGQWQSPLCFHFYLGDFHVASLLGMTFGAIAITAMPFEQISLLL